MSTRKPKSPIEDALEDVPAEFRRRIVKAYLEVKSRHAESKHDAAGVSAGKLCESVIRLLQHELKKPVTPFGQQLTNFPGECDSFAQVPKTVANESLRLVIPKALSLLYILRNKRGIGHVGGDVDANAIDGITIARVADWVICELIRVFHTMSFEDADALVASLASRDVPDVWEVAGRKRVLRTDLDFKQKTLLLLYSSTDVAVLAEDLFAWCKYSNFAVYKQQVLRQLDSETLVDYDPETTSVILSPLGTKVVEEQILGRKFETASNKRLRPAAESSVTGKRSRRRG
jgi:hypothetical protein